MVHTQSFELTGFQRDLLYVIAGSDQPSGQTIRRKLNLTSTTSTTVDSTLISTSWSTTDSSRKAAKTSVPTTTR